LYDTVADKVLCLSPQTSRIWDFCDGRSTIGNVAEQLRKEIGLDVGIRDIFIVLREFERYNLLEKSDQSHPSPWKTDRRQFLEKAGRAAAIAIPIIMCISVPTAAQTVSKLPDGAPCTNNAQCMSGKCEGGICVP
jgi:hypothetical protein